MRILPEPITFEWDSGNKDKSWLKHKVSVQECEYIFNGQDSITFRDIEHSFKESRYIILGKNSEQRLLFIAFTIRRDKIRVISARVASSRERKLYEKEVGTSKI